jgi:hypothetical protein
MMVQTILADELTEFFRFMVWNDLTEEEEEQKLNLTDKWKVVHSPTRLFKCEAGKLYIRPRGCSSARLESCTFAQEPY